MAFLASLDGVSDVVSGGIFFIMDRPVPCWLVRRCCVLAGVMAVILVMPSELQDHSQVGNHAIPPFSSVFHWRGPVSFRASQGRCFRLKQGMSHMRVLNGGWPSNTSWKLCLSSFLRLFDVFSLFLKV